METRTNNAFEHCKTPQELYDVIEGVLCPRKDPQSRKSAKLDQTRHYGIFFEGHREYYGQDGKLFDKRTLEEVHLAPDLVAIHEDARTRALTFRKLCSRLPTLPPHNSNAVAGLQEIMEWCIEPQKATLSRGRRIIGWIVEGIIALAFLVICSYFFGLVTGILVLSALLAIFNYLGWLEPIKAFIDKIVGKQKLFC